MSSKLNAIYNNYLLSRTIEHKNASSKRDRHEESGNDDSISSSGDDRYGGGGGGNSNTTTTTTSNTKKRRRIDENEDDEIPSMVSGLLMDDLQDVPLNPMRDNYLNGMGIGGDSDNNNVISLDEMQQQRNENRHQKPYIVSCKHIRVRDIQQKDDRKREIIPSLSDYESSCVENATTAASGGSSSSEHDADLDSDVGSNRILPFSSSTAITTKKKEKTKKKKNLSRGNCFGCMWGIRGKGAIEGDNMNKCLQIIDDNYGFMANAELAKTVHLYFKDKIYGPMKKAFPHEKIPIWTTEQILNHIENHTLEPRIFIGESIRKFTAQFNIAYDRVFMEQTLSNGEVIQTLDPKAAKNMLDTHRALIRLYQLRPKAMNFYNEDCRIDFDVMGKRVNPIGIGIKMSGSSAGPSQHQKRTA